MFRKVARKTFPSMFALGLMLLSVGCSQRAGGDLAFRRFWGFDSRLNPAVAAQGDRAAFSGIVPKLLGQPTGNEPMSEDPFLNQDFTRTADAGNSSSTGEQFATNGQSLDEGYNDLALFDAPPLQPGQTPESSLPKESVSRKTATEGGNPFRLTQHETPVNNISSLEDQTKPPESKPALLAVPSGSSQLNRLKVALNRDAKTQLPMKSPIEGTEVARQRVEAMMKNARRQLQFGEYESALRWAIAAEKLAARAELFFGPEEDPPADLVRSLEDHLKIQTEQPVPEQQIANAGQAISVIDPSAEPPMLSLDFPDGSSQRGPSPFEMDTMQELQPPPSAEAATGAMKQAVIAPQQTHPRSLKVDAQRVSANQGAVVSVEGQLNPPVESPFPELPLAPPALEEPVSLPPFEVAMTEPLPIASTTPPPLPPPSEVPQSQQQSVPHQFLYADNSLPAPKPFKNVEWNESEESGAHHTTLGRAGWIFPLIGVLGLGLMGWLLLRRKTA